jgi:hypothetical protein
MVHLTMKQISINGIRLGRKMVRVDQAPEPGQAAVPVYETFSRHRINMVCAGLHHCGATSFFSCCLEAKHKDHAAQILGCSADLPGVCMVSIYPHHGNIQVPGLLMQLLGRAGIRFFHLVSSHAVVCVVVETNDQDAVISLLESAFDLPPSHTPYCQEIDEDISRFLQKYPETRAFYVEEKIKTYGIQVRAGLELYQTTFTQAAAADAGEQMFYTARSDNTARSDKKFHLVSAMPGPEQGYDLFVVTDPGAGTPDMDAGRTDMDPGRTDMDPGRMGMDAGRMAFGRADMDPGGRESVFDRTPFRTVDLISFHGPHFGDRYKIFWTAMDCLTEDHVPVLVAGCTGASISLAVPDGQGRAARNALARGFEAP